MKIKYFLLWVIVLFAAAGGYGALIAPDGKVYQQIVISESAPASVRLAAGEFQTFMRRSCQAELPIVHEATAFPVIYIGDSPAMRQAAGIDPAQLPQEGFVIRTGRDHLAIVGRDYDGEPLTGYRNPWRAVEVYNRELQLGAFGEAGTLTGVYEFLRTQAGIRFYMPGELGMVIPEKTELKLSTLDITGQPRVTYRYPWFANYSVSKNDVLWARRIGFGGKAPVMIIHSFDLFLRYKDSNPEYFALVDGKRATGGECVADGKGHLCLNNPAVIRRWADDIIQYFQQHPEVDVFPLAPNDGLTRICECPACQADLRPDAPENGKFSYHIWNFVAKVAKLVAERYPDKYVGCLAYEKYRTPPPEIGRMDNVAVMFCNRRSDMVSPATAAALHAEIASWSQKAGRIYLWSWYLDHRLPWNGLPVIYTQTVVRELDYMFSNPLYCGEFIESENERGQQPGDMSISMMTTPGLQHINLYFTARKYWQRDFDWEKEFNEYCELFYGPAAQFMKAFFLESETRRAECFARAVTSPDLVFTSEFIIHLKDLLTRAAQSVPADSLYARRIALIRREFEIGSGRLLRLEASGSRRLVLPVVQNETLDPASAANNRFVSREGTLMTPATWIFAGYDRRYLYLKFLCYEPDMSSIVTRIRDNDNGAIWEDDTIELFLCPDESDRSKCFHIIVSAAGVICDGRIVPGAKDDLSWQSQAQVRCVKENNRWVLDIRLPFNAIGISDPFFAGDLAVNFYRNRNRSGDRYKASCWNPTGVWQYYCPDKFGILELKK